MIVKLKLVSGATEIFKTESYVVSTIKDLHPDILQVEVFLENGRRLKKVKRKNWRNYVKHDYKPLPQKDHKEM